MWCGYGRGVWIWDSCGVDVPVGVLWCVHGHCVMWIWACCGVDIGTVVCIGALLCG